MIDRPVMWGILLTNAAGEAMRDWCRRSLEARPDAARARLVSTDGLLEYVYPEGEPG